MRGNERPDAHLPGMCMRRALSPPRPNRSKGRAAGRRPWLIRGGFLARIFIWARPFAPAVLDWARVEAVFWTASTRLLRVHCRRSIAPLTAVVTPFALFADHYDAVGETKLCTLAENAARPDASFLRQRYWHVENWGLVRVLKRSRSCLLCAGWGDKHQ